MEAPDKNRGSLAANFDGFEFSPSEDTWSKIESKLEDGPGILMPPFAEFSHSPSPQAWTGIQKRLGQQGYYGGKWAYMAVASILATLAISTLLVMNPFASKSSAPVSKDASPTRNMAIGEMLCMDESNPVKYYKLDFVPWSLNFNQYMHQFPICGGVQYVDLSQSYPSFLFSGGQLPADPTTDTQDAAVSEKAAQPKQDSIQSNPIIEQPLPIIELPEGTEAEGAWSIQIGGNLSTGATTRYESLQSMRDGYDAGFGVTNGLSESLGEVKETYQMPIVFGVDLAVPLSKRVALMPGVKYTLLRSTIEEENLDISRHYLGVSVAAKVDVIQGKKGGVYAIAGVQADAGLDSQVKKTTQNTLYAHADEIKAGNQLSCHAGAGAQYMVTKHLGLYAQGMAASYLLQSRQNVYSSKAVWPSIQAGLRVEL